MILVYVAGAYSHGDVAENVKTAMEAGTQLIEAGFAVFIPHLFHFLHLYNPQEYERWMAIDAELIARCDAVLRLPGYSPGADREVVDARQRNIPVLATVDEVCLWFSLNRKERVHEKPSVARDHSVSDGRLYDLQARSRAAGDGD